MKKELIVLAICVAVMAAAAAVAEPVRPAWTPSDRAFSAFLERFSAGMNDFLNGDPRAWKQNASHSDRATIMGAWGAYENSWAQASSRYDWAAARFEDSDARAEIEYLSGGVSGDLAYTVAIERSAVQVIGQQAPATMQLRVTHVFGRENGEWKLLHRHADPLIAKTAPADVLAR